MFLSVLSVYTDEKTTDHCLSRLDWFERDELFALQPTLTSSHTSGASFRVSLYSLRLYEF